MTTIHRHSGQVLSTKTIFPHPPQGQHVAAERALTEMLEEAMLEGGALVESQ